MKKSTNTELFLNKHKLQKSKDGDVCNLGELCEEFSSSELDKMVEDLNQN